MRSVFIGVIVFSAVVAATGVLADESAAPIGLRNRSIAYVLTRDDWALYSTPEKKECPEGVNELGPREQFPIRYPITQPRKVVETELDYESKVWFPTLEPEAIVLKEATGKIAPGLNLDGKVGLNDFVSPEGEVGIDNQFQRVLGCISDYRPGGTLRGLWDYHFMHFHTYTRVLIELTDVDSLENDNDVTVTMYRGRDDAATDASGNNFVPFGTERIDTRWGKDFMRRTHGRITNGVLTTEPIDLNVPYNYAFEDLGMYTMRASRLKLRLTPEQAQGLWAGYVDIESWYRTLIGALGTHSMQIGRQAAPTMYRAMYKSADAFPDPKTGRNTAISGAREVSFIQVFIDHTDKNVASMENETSRADQRGHSR